jgi:hypothetical protein
MKQKWNGFRYADTKNSTKIKRLEKKNSLKKNKRIKKKLKVAKMK